MKIEIKTKISKLTRSMVNQMQMPGLEQLKRGKVLGYMINAKRDSYKTILIECNNEYFVINTSWKKNHLSVYRSIGRGSTSLKFDTSDACDKWWVAYQEVINNAKTHIYI